MKRIQPCKSLHYFLCPAVLIFAFVPPQSLGAQQKSPTTRTSPCVIPDPANGVPTLDIVLEGTIALVQQKSGAIEVFFPQVPGHMTPYYLSLNEGVLAPSKAGDYGVKTSMGGDIPSPSCATVIAPDTNWPLLTVPYSQTATIDPAGARFLSILLPKPYAILPMHGDPAELKASDPCDTPSTLNNLPMYATRVALRYVVNDFNLWLYDPSSVKTQLSIPQIGNGGTLFFGVGPEQPDDETHHHARVSFQKLQDLLPIQRQYVAFPLGPASARDRVRSGIDCRAPIILLTPQ